MILSPKILGLTVIEDEFEIANKQKVFEDSIINLADKKVNARAGFQGGEEVGTTYWSNNLGIWFQSRKIDDSRYWNGFGLEEPEEGKGYTIITEINFPIKGIKRGIAGAIAKDSNNHYYILHRGKLGGNYGKKDFIEKYEGKWTLVQDGDKKTEMVIIGKLNDPNLPNNVSNFVKAVYKIKNGKENTKVEKVKDPDINDFQTKSFYDFLVEKGYYFDKEIIENYLLSLKVKPFIILTGNSGTGKTKLAQLFAQYLSRHDQDENNIVTYVKANPSSKKYKAWTLSRSDLAPLNLTLERDFEIKVDDIGTTAKLSMSPRLWYNDPDKKIEKLLEDVSLTDPDKKIKIDILTSKNDSSRYEIVPIGANWTESRHIIGFYNVITEKYQKTISLDLILDAQTELDKPYFLILDEMNLSHVERYFADFLSALESGEKIPLHKNIGDGIKQEIELPNNLLVVGTVNVDETTYMFSPKVLDRANTIEFSTYSPVGYMMNDFDDKKPQGDIKYLEAPLTDSEIRNYDINELRNLLEDIYSPERDSIWSLLAMELELFQNVLKKAGFDFGFRVINEILRFMCVAWRYEGEKRTWDNWERYFDAQIKQKMLPKLHGSERTLGDTILELSKLCLDQSENIRFNTSYQKIKEMEKVLYEQRYVSFIN